nr:phospholipase-like protein [Tanacetum cinerariifolium]
GSREVDVSTNVHHDVNEGLSVPELLKKIFDMQRDFQSRITAVEQFVNHHKTSDSHVPNVFSNSMKFDDHVLEEPQLSGLNFIVEEHQEVSSKNCEVPLSGAEKIAVDALMKILNFDIPKEDLFRPKHAPKTRPIMPPEISDMLRDNKDKCFYFPWTNEGKERSRWMSDTVYFPINAEDNHWILAEFHIRFGVITFYDSLPPENLIVEDRKWWLYARQVYADKLPKLLIQSEVVE